MSSRFVFCLSFAAVLAIAQADESTDALDASKKGMFSKLSASMWVPEQRWHLLEGFTSVLDSVE